MNMVIASLQKSGIEIRIAVEQKRVGNVVYLFEFFLNYTKLAMLAKRLLWGRAKKLPHVGIEPGTSCDPL